MSLIFYGSVLFSFTCFSLVSFLCDQLRRQCFIVSHGGEEVVKGSDCELLTGEGFQWKAARDGQVPKGAVQVN